MKLWLEDNGIEIYSTHNERKSVAAESFIRTLKNLTSISKMCIFINQMILLINTTNNICHSTIKMKPVDVKLSTYIDSAKKIMKKILNLKLVNM